MTAPAEPITPGERVLAIRKRLGLSLRSVAELSGGAIGYGTVRSVERPDCNWAKVEIGTAQALARAYRLPLATFLAVVLDGEALTAEAVRQAEQHLDAERRRHEAHREALAVRLELARLHERLDRLGLDADGSQP